jgi:septal ring factor EnvC (AmiA/AmiB activator)
MTDPQGNLLDRIKSAYGVYPPVDPLLRDAHDLIERLRDLHAAWGEVRHKLEAQVKWLEKDNKSLRQTLDYARTELQKADKRAAHFAKRSEELEKALRRLADQDATLSVVGGNVIVQMDSQ